MTATFAMIYKILPRVRIGWRDVWVGAAVTALLFAIGKSLIGLYLGRSTLRLGLRRRRVARRAARLDVLLGADLPARRRVHLGLCARPRVAFEPRGAGSERLRRDADAPRSGGSARRGRAHALAAALQLPRVAGSSLRRRHAPARTSSSSSPTTSASPTSAATAAALPVSPVLDRLAADGIRFTQGYANSPVCSPTRFALMTGRYQYRLRGAAEEPINSRSRGSTTLGLPPEHPTLPSLLQGGRLPHRARRQVAPRLPARVRPAALGLRRVLRPDVGRRRLLHATATRAARTTCGDGEAEQREEGYLTDLISRRAVDFIERVARPDGSAVLPQPALHRAALAVGDARRRSARATR